MYTVMLASECAPVAKVGGLGDVVYGLGRELQIRGNAVEIILPKYDCMRYDHINNLHVTFQDLFVPWNGGKIRCTVYFGFVHGLKCFFIEPHSKENFFSRGNYYGFPDEPMRYAFFTKAAMEFLYKSGKRPDIIHTHDWHTALASVFLYEIYNRLGMDRTRTCHTIHNFKHQGVTGAGILSKTGLNRPEYYLAKERLGDNFNTSAINLAKGGIVYANFVTTVSPTHADEAMHTQQGHGLGQTLKIHAKKFGGVLNGLDYDMWNPSNDPYIPHSYGVNDIDAKYRNKEALRDKLMLRQDFKPIIAYIGRLDTQKGVHLIRHALFYAIQNDAQFVLLGSSPDTGINDHFWHLKHDLNTNPNCHLEIGYNEELAHLIYAGADLQVVPSMFEPCGLTQMIALRYGTVPVVRAVGGLKDTVFDYDYADKPAEQRNGYTFNQSDEPALESALKRALGLWRHQPQRFRELIANGMRYDYSWNHPGQNYVNIYHHILR